MIEREREREGEREGGREREGERACVRLRKKGRKEMKPKKERYKREREFFWFMGIKNYTKYAHPNDNS